MEAKISEALKSYRRDGYNFKYINLRWLWIAISVVVCAYFINSEIESKTDEYLAVKERCSSYIDHPVELPVPSIVASMLLAAKEEKIPADINKYHYLNSLGRDLSNFDSLLLGKVGVQGWFVGIDSVNQYSRIALFHPGYHLVYAIEIDEINKNTVGSRPGLYFNYKLRFREGKFFTLLTWSPDLKGFYLWDGTYILFMAAVTFCAVPILGYLALMFLPGFRRQFWLNDLLDYPRGEAYAYNNISRELKTTTKYVFHSGASIYLVG